MNIVVTLSTLGECPVCPHYQIFSMTEFTNSTDVSDVTCYHWEQRPKNSSKDTVTTG